MTDTLMNVKAEIRILGLDTCANDRIMGVVSRGGLYLDGVISFTISTRLRVNSLAKSIIKMNHFPELKIIMLHDPKRSISERTIEQATKLPTIRFSVETQSDHGTRKTIKRNRTKLGVATRLDATTLGQILSQTMVKGTLPEPLRIAHILSRTDLGSETVGR